MSRLNSMAASGAVRSAARSRHERQTKPHAIPSHLPLIYPSLVSSILYWSPTKFTGEPSGQPGANPDRCSQLPFPSAYGPRPSRPCEPGLVPGQGALRSSRDSAEWLADIFRRGRDTPFRGEHIGEIGMSLGQVRSRRTVSCSSCKALS